MRGLASSARSLLALPVREKQRATINAVERRRARAERAVERRRVRAARAAIGGVLCALAVPACMPSALGEPRQDTPRQAPTGARPQSPAAALADPALDQRARELLAPLTLAEKLGQLNQVSHGADTGPGGARRDYSALIAAGGVGSFLNLTGPQETNALQRVAVEQSRSKVPLLFGLDVIHGYWTTFPIPLALSCTWNPELVEQTARLAACEATRDGIRWTFSPMVDIARDARWGRIAEGAGEDPFLGAALARAYVRGYQGERLSGATSLAACAKHYVGYGAAEAGRDYNTTEIAEGTLRDVYLPPFQAAVDAGAATLMSAFNSLNGVPATANAATLDYILRGEWGFRGFVVSDWGAIRELIPHGVALDGRAAARKALLAGVDMDMESHLFATELAAEVDAGRVPLTAVDDAVRRILRVKLALGLFERPYAEERSSPPAELDSEAVALARQAAEQSLVLLKNDAVDGPPVLPLRESVRTLALIGPLADSAGDMLGCWTARGDAKHVVTLRASMAVFAAARKIELVYDQGVQLAGAPGGEPGAAGRVEFASAIAAAQRADVVLLALGEPAAMTGEAASRTDIGLPARQAELFEIVARTGKPVVLVVFSGRPLALAPQAARAAAVVQAWHPGVQAGPALVRVLSGEADFSGRLTVSMPRSVGQLPLYYNHLNTGRPAGDKDEKFVSRYLDERHTPLFPFGYGLSYARFEIDTPTLSDSSVPAAALNAASRRVRVSADVRNTGDRDGVAVVQLYTRQTGTSVARPVRELKGFQRVGLRAGESRAVEFSLGREELAFWTMDAKRVVEPGAVSVWVAADSASGAPAEFAIGD
ncbi:MAG: beta-glucosidase BglX [Phycisphaerae bacterium]